MQYGGFLVSWKSKKQTSVSRSLAEVEYRSIATIVTEIIWMKGLIKELNIEVPLPINIHIDRKAVMQLATNPIYHDRTKHIEIDCHFIREKITQGLVSTKYIPTQDQPADQLTKGLTKVQLQHLSSKLGVLIMFSLPILRGSVENEKNEPVQCVNLVLICVF